MIRQFLKKKLRSTAVKVFNMEFDVEERDKRPPRSTPQAFDKSIIPNIVDGSGDTPGPNHKEKVGRTVVSAEILSGFSPFLIDIRPPNEIVSGMLPGALILPNRSIEHCMDVLPAKDKRIAIYDQTGELGSPEVAAWLREQGWSWARYLDGGYAEWIEQGEQTVLPAAISTPTEADKTWRLGDEINIDSTRRAYVLQTNDTAVELWSERDGYLGWILQSDLPA